MYEEKSFREIQRDEYFKKEIEAKKYKKEKQREKLKKEIKKVKDKVIRVKKYIPNPLPRSIGMAAGLRQSVRGRARQPPEETKVVRPLTNPMPYHLDMKQPRDSGFRPHEPRSLVKEPDIEGYQRNLLLQPAKNIWEEPRKANVWDETFGNMKKKSLFDTSR